MAEKNGESGDPVVETTWQRLKVEAHVGDNDGGISGACGAQGRSLGGSNSQAIHNSKAAAAAQQASEQGSSMQASEAQQQLRQAMHTRNSRVQQMACSGSKNSKSRQHRPKKSNLCASSVVSKLRKQLAWR
jgi:hypothetical protein